MERVGISSQLADRCPLGPPLLKQVCASVSVPESVLLRPS